MSGSGRRTHYRKHLTDSVLNEFPEPNLRGNEKLAKIIGSRGGNIFEVLVASHETGCRSDEGENDTIDDVNASGDARETNNCENPNTDATVETPPVSQKSRLAILPTKYRKLVWIKRGDFVIVHCGDEGEDGIETTGIRFMIKHVLYKKQITHLKKKSLWPRDPLFKEEDDCTSSKNRRHAETAEEESKGNKDVSYSCTSRASGQFGDENEDYSANDDLYCVNTNHIARMRVVDSDAESSCSDY